jgi:hypothetical protein
VAWAVTLSESEGGYEILPSSSNFKSWQGEEKGVTEQVCMLSVLGWENSVVGGWEVDRGMGIYVQRIYRLKFYILRT